MKYVAYFLLLVCLTLSLTYNSWAPQPPVGSRPPYIDLPEELAEATVGTPMFVSTVSADTISIVFDPMKDRLFWIPNPGCEFYDCKASVIWVDLEGRTIYIEDGHAELVDFENDLHLFDALRWVLEELSQGKRFDKSTGEFLK